MKKTNSMDSLSDKLARMHTRYGEERETQRKKINLF